MSVRLVIETTSIVEVNSCLNKDFDYDDIHAFVGEEYEIYRLLERNHFNHYRNGRFIVLYDFESKQRTDILFSDDFV